MRRFKNLSLNILLCIGIIVPTMAQVFPVQIQVVVQPPYSPYFADYIIYENKATFILIGQPKPDGEPYEVYLKGLIEGDNGVLIQTDENYRPPTPISVPAGGQITLTGGELDDYFSTDNVTYTGIEPSDVIFGDGLPEGIYTICATAYDWETEEQMSADVPSGCSAPYLIVHVDPPQIITPTCGFNVQPQTPQQVIISWTLPAIAGAAQIEYNLQITEMFEGQVPGEAFEALLTPAFFEMTLNTNTYIYGLADPELEPGKQYAMRVQAIDPQNQIVFRNNGYSEPCHFIYQSYSLFGFPVDEEDGTFSQIDINPFPGFLYPVAMVSGALNYKFKGDGIDLDVGQEDPFFDLYTLYNPNQNDYLLQGQEIELSAAQESVQVELMKPVFNTSNISTSNSHPLANTNIKLVSLPLFFHGTYTQGAEAVPNYDEMETVAATTTDSEGNFSFTFMCPEELGVRKETAWIEHPTFDRFGNPIMGEVTDGVAFKVLRIIVESPYYCSPETNIVLDSWESLELETQVSYVNSYTLHVQARKIQDERYQQLDANINYLPNVDAKLKRYDAITGVPIDEGEKSYPENTIIPPYDQIVAEGKTNSSGYFEIQQLVRHDKDNPLDHYKIVFTTSEYAGEYNYTGNGKYTPPITDTYYHPYTYLGAPTQPYYNFLWNSDHAEEVFLDYVELRPRLPRIYGQVRAKQLPVDMNEAMDNFVGTLGVGMSVQSAVNSYSGNAALQTQTPTPAPSGLGIFSTPSSSSGFTFGAMTQIVQQMHNWGNSANLAPIPDAGMVLFSYCPPNISLDFECSIHPANVFESTYTDQAGRYEFRALWMLEDPSNTEGGAWSVYGPARKVMTKPEGFKYAELPTNAQGHKVLVWGEQLQLNFNLDPDGFVFGWVEDDQGNPAKATVFIDSLTTVETVYDPAWKVLLGIGPAPKEIFVLRAPSGSRTLTIVPDDPGLGLAEYTVDIEENISEYSPQNLGGFVVNTYMHRIKFSVVEAGIPFFDPNTGKTYEVENPVKNALVKVTNILSNAPEENLKFGNPPQQNEPQPQEIFPQTNPQLMSDGSWGYTDGNGVVNLNFRNNANAFQIEFLPPVDRPLVKKTLNIVSEASLETVDHGTVILEPALQLSGIVTYGPDSLALPGGRVFIDLGGEFYSTITYQNGGYKLTGMPLDANSYDVTAENLTVEGTLLAQTKIISDPFPMILNFHLEEFTDFSITTLYDLPVSISDIQPQNANYIVDGAFINLPENENFSPKDADVRLKFANVEITVVIENNEPVAQPVQNQFDLLETNLDLWSYTQLIATLLPGDNANKLRVKADENGKGAIMGTVRLESSSFQFDENYMNLNGEEQSTQNSGFQSVMNQYQLIQNYNAQQLSPGPSSQLMYITLFVNNTSELHYFDVGTDESTLPTINAAPYPKRTFNLHNGQGQNFEYKIQDFRAEARKMESYAYNDSVHLATSIFAEQIPLMVPSILEVDLGMVNVTKDGFEEISGDTPLQFNLEEWQVACDSWSLNQYSLGIQAPFGELTTELFTTDLKDIKITNTSFAQPKIDMNKLALGGVIDVNVLSGTTFFGINPSCTSDGQAHWELSVVSDGGPAVSIDALPGMMPGDQIFFDQASVWSNSEQRLDMGAIAQTLEFYEVVKVTPTNFEFLTDGVKLTGMFDLEVPRMSKGTGGFIYHDTPNGLESEFTGMVVNFIAKGKVHFIGSNVAGAQTILNKLFEARGYVEDEDNDGFHLEALFRKDVVNDSILVFVDPLHQILPVADDGSNWFAEITGRMYVDKNMADWDHPGKGDWDYFRFAGDMEGFVGVEPSKKRKNFTVEGGINAEGEGMDIENISVDFAGISITYDFPNQRLTGGLEFNQSFSSVTISGAVDFLADRDGWYFVANGMLEFPGFGSLKAGLGIGDYVIVDINDPKNQFLLTQLSANTYQNQLPISFMDGFSGFFFTAKKSIPQLDIPDMSFNFIIVTAYLGGEVGINATLWMEFQGDGMELGIGVMAYLEAYLGMESITCTTIEGSIEVVLGILGVFNTGSGAYNITGCGGITLSGTVIQGIPNPITFQCEDAINETGEVSMKADIQVSNSGFDASIGMGTCFSDTMTNEF